MGFIDSYKDKYHVSLNFWGVFLLLTFIPDILGFNPSLIVYPLWALKIVLAILVIRQYKKRIYNLQREEQLFLFVALVFAINIFIDVFMRTYPVGMAEPLDFISFCVSILIAFSFRYDSAFSNGKSYKYLVVTLSVGLFLALFFAVESDTVGHEGRYGANSSINTINYGQMGCSLFLLALYGMINKRFKYGRLIFFTLMVLGVISIMKAGSRSPLVVIIMVSTFYAMTQLGFFKGVLLCVLMGGVLWFSLDFLIEFGVFFDSSLAERVVHAVVEKETSGRNAIYANTIDLIKNAPVFGDYYLIPSGAGKGLYPHNFFLEAFLTNGLIGGIAFAAMVGIAVFRSWRFLRSRHEAGWIVLLFLQLLVFGMISSPLYSSQDFWALCLFVLSITWHYKMNPADGKKAIKAVGT